MSTPRMPGAIHTAGAIADHQVVELVEQLAAEVETLKKMVERLEDSSFEKEEAIRQKEEAQQELVDVQVGLREVVENATAAVVGMKAQQEENGQLRRVVAALTRQLLISRSVTVEDCESLSEKEYRIGYIEVGELQWDGKDSMSSAMGDSGPAGQVSGQEEPSHRRETAYPGEVEVLEKINDSGKISIPGDWPDRTWLGVRDSA